MNNRLLIGSTIVLVATATAFAKHKPWVNPDLSKVASEVTEARQTVESTPAGTPAYNAAVAQVNQGLTKIESIGDREAGTYEAQEAVGMTLVKFHEFDRAARFADRAVAQATAEGDPVYESRAYLLRGNVLYGQKKYEEALKDAEAILKIDPRNKSALELKYASAGRVNGGAQASSAGTAAGGGGAAAANSAPATAQAPAGASASFATMPGGYKPAVVPITATEDQRKADGLMREAAARLKMDPSAAVGLMDRALQADANNPHAYFLRAAAKRAAGDLQGAMADLDAAVRLLPNFPEAHAARAAMGIALGRSADEIKKDFIASGEAEVNFASYYAEQVAALGAKKSPQAGAKADAAAGGPWGSAGGLPARIRENAGALLLVGLGLVMFAGGLLWVTRRRMNG